MPPEVRERKYDRWRELVAHTLAAYSKPEER
jgi:hypothetical protein